jgi:ATP-dependent Lon protease
MPQLISLKLAKSRTPRSPEHQRFEQLLRQVERARAQLSAWRENQARFRQAYSERVMPAQSELHAAKREWVIGLDAIFGRKGWTKAERLTLDFVIRVQALELLQELGPDEELRAIYERHSDVTLEEEQERELEITRAMAERMTGLDFSEDDIASEEELFARVRAAMEEREHAHEETQKHTSDRKKSAAEIKRETEASLATQSIREIYRRLVSNLHPDREPDVQRRAQKNELMQRVNQAYESNDLLTLLEVQLEIEQIDADELSNSSAERLRQYNKVLAEQLRDIKQQLDAAEESFRAEFGIEDRINPHRLHDHAERMAKAVQLEKQALQRDLGMLKDRQMVKEWLRWELRRMSASSDRDFV